MQHSVDQDVAAGFPAEYWKRLQGAYIWGAGVLVVLVLAACFLVRELLAGNWSAAGIALVSAVLIYLAVVTVASLHELRSAHKRVRIVPYFEAEVPGPDTFFDSGYALARNCAHLDEIALREGLVPLSAFGFADRFLGPWSCCRERVAWHSPDECLKTIDGLLEYLQEHPDTLIEADDVKADLERIQVRLREACRLNVRFCLHLRWDLSYTGLEFEQRVGKY